MKNCLMPVLFLLAAGGCFSNSAYFLPQGATTSPLDMGPAAVYSLTEHEPPGGPAFLAVSSRGMVRSLLKDGKNVALLHVRFAFRNRSGLDAAFDPAAVKVNLFVARNNQPVPLKPTWIRPQGDVVDNRVPKGKTGVFDLYFAVAPVGVVSSTAAFTVEWAYTLGDEEVASSTAFGRAPSRAYYDYASSPVPPGYYGARCYVGPSFYWWWPPVVLSVGGRTYGGGSGSSWIRR